MPAARITPDLEMHYEVDDYTDPWTQPETVLLLHGNAESAAMWFGWVPTLARHFRVVRTDMRGFARSTPMPRDYKWTHVEGRRLVRGARFSDTRSAEHCTFNMR